MRIKARQMLFSVILCCISLYCILYIQMGLDNRQFQFEKYRTQDSFEEAIVKQFPLRSNIEDTLNTLTLSGAKCEIYDHRNDKEWDREKYNREYLVYCGYSTGWFSLYPLEFYRISIHADRDLKIIHQWTERTKGLVI